jgi:hypothetical protein
MRREPSIHITESNLRYLIRKYYDFSDYIDDEVDEMTSFLMTNAVKMSLEKRLINVTNQTVATKVFSKATNDKSDISLLANLIFMVRKDLKHRGIKPIDTISAEWTQLKKLTPIVNQFCEEFSLEKREGYIIYIRAGLAKISSYRGYITKLYDMSESISLEYQANLSIINDENINLTKEIHDYYIQLVALKTGVYENYKDNPLMYSKFIEIARIVTKLKISYKSYIQSQFVGLDWTNSYPDPGQLVSDKALGRLNKFLYSKGSKITEKKEISDKSFVEKLKNIKNGKN